MQTRKITMIIREKKSNNYAATKTNFENMAKAQRKSRKNR